LSSFLLFFSLTSSGDESNVCSSDLSSGNFTNWKWNVPWNPLHGHRCQFHQYFTCNFFIQKYFAQLFSNYSLAFIFWQKNISAKTTYKMFMKLTTGWGQTRLGGQMQNHLHQVIIKLPLINQLNYFFMCWKIFPFLWLFEKNLKGF